MAAGTGVTYTEAGPGKYKIRWRERKADGGWTGRSTTIEGIERDAARRVIEIEDALRATGTYDARAVKVAALPPANLADGLEAFIAARVASGKFSGKTAQIYRSYAFRVAEGLHAVTGTPEDEPLPVTVLNRENIELVMARDRATKISEMTAYASLRLLLDGWRYMCTERDRFPHVPDFPLSTRDYLPKTPKYTRTVAPTIAHVDACLRHLPAGTHYTTRMLGIWLRFTGLRADTILAIRREDIDLDGKQLYIGRDKNAYQRIVPLSDRLLAEVAPFLQTVKSGSIFAKRRHATRRADTPKKKPTETFKAAWTAATEANQAPRWVWAPPNRKNARPEHALRAALDAFLIAQGTAPEVVDYLVGRNEDDVRSVHYGGDILDAARRAVNLVPAIDWVGPQAPDNVVPMVAG